MQEINIYDAMRLMRKLSAENFPFIIEFASCDRTRRISKGKVVVEKAKLIKGLKQKQSKHAKLKIFYENMDTGEQRNFWMPLLLKVNDFKITLERFNTKK